MPTFHYEALDADGQPLSGKIEADSAAAASAELVGRGLTVGRIERVVAAEPAAIRLGERDFVQVAEGLSTVAATGLPLVSGLLALSEEMPSSRIRRGLQELARQVESGQSLDEALPRLGGRVPPELRTLVNSGLSTGNVRAFIDLFLVHSQTRLELNRRIVLALAYPAVILGMLALVVLATLCVAIPQFEKIYEDFGTELPGLTLFIIHVSRFVRAHWLTLPIGALVVFAALWALVFAIGGRPLVRRLGYLTPLVGPLVRYVALFGFCHRLSFSVEAGERLPEAIRHAGDGTGDANLQQGARRLSEAIEDGHPPYDAARRLPHFPPDLVHVFRWTNDQEAFAEALLAAGEVYAARSRVQATLMTMVIEPALIVVAAMFLAVVAVALFMPLLKLLNDLA